MSKQFVAILVIIIVGLFGLFAFVSKSDKSNENNSSNSTSSGPSNHVVGAGNKKVTLTEYGDFECPACKAYYPLVKQVKETYGDDITFQFRHFPLVQIHPNALLASRAVEAAGKQGKFFEMHDLMYENQDAWKTQPTVNTVFESFAERLGLNMIQYKADVTAESTAATINADIKEGQKVGANSTPTFVINGKKINENPKSFEEFKKLIDEAIAQANQTQ